MTTIVTNVGYLDSAWKHGLSMAEIDHALNNPLEVHYFDGWTMVIGPDQSGRLLEIGVNDDNMVFHAMKARAKYLRRR